MHQKHKNEITSAQKNKKHWQQNVFLCTHIKTNEIQYSNKKTHTISVTIRLQQKTKNKKT